MDACFDGQEALDYLAAAKYDAVVLDVMMPHVDGFEVLTFCLRVQSESGLRTDTPRAVLRIRPRRVCVFPPDSVRCLQQIRDDLRMGIGRDAGGVVGKCGKAFANNRAGSKQSKDSARLVYKTVLLLCRICYTVRRKLVMHGDKGTVGQAGCSG